MNTKISINLNTLDSIISFSKIVITFKSDINIYQESKYYDAKSILSIFNLDMTKSHYVEIVSNDQEEIKRFNEVMYDFV